MTPRRAPSLLAHLALVAALCLPSRAGAVDPRAFEPPLSAGAVLGLDTTRLAPPLVPFVALAASLAAREVDDATTRLVSALVVGLAPIDALELGVGASLHQIDDEAGPGDVRVGLKLRLTDRDAPAGVALALATALPTGGPRYASEGGLALDARVIVDLRATDALATLSLGYRLRPGGRLAEIEVDDELRFGVGVEGRLVAALALVAEVEGALGLSVHPDARNAPLEARLGARVRLDDWALTVAAGTRLTDGYGAPDARLVVALAWGPAPLPPRAARTSPVAAPASRVGPPPPVDLALVLAADPDADGDAVPTPMDKCPDDPEDHDRFRDGDGCPDPDNDADGVDDAADRCPIDREVVNGLDDHDGCPDALPPGPDGAPPAGPALDDDGLIRLPGAITFRSGSDELTPEAVALLAQVARFLQARPAIERVRIEGHTDDRGDEEEQVDLSERRAASVRQALVARGVAADRLLPKGFGKTRPLTDNRDDAARQVNRRVELRVVERPDDGGPP
ncbi:MAG: OmpA family protein [Deltaproteobacteria bacterium]|nr:OmpA family protein [Deltaproteobacteria bacterium]